MTQATAELGRLPLGLVFMFQSILFVAPIFLSYIAYTRVRTKTKARSIVEDLNQLGYTFESIKELGGDEVRAAAVYASYQAAAAPDPDDEDGRETTRRDQSGLNRVQQRLFGQV